MEELAVGEFKPIWEPEIRLSADLKIGKYPVKAVVDGSTPESAVDNLKRVIALLTDDTSEPDRRIPKSAAPTTEEEATTEKPAKPKAQGGKRDAKKNAELQARQMNEEALLWTRRAITAIPHFQGMSEQQVAEALKCRTAMALMTAEESGKLIQMIQDTLTTYAHANSDVAAYLKILGVIDRLATPEEWDQKKLTEIGSGDWAALQVNGSHLLKAAQAECEARKNLLAAASLAGLAG